MIEIPEVFVAPPHPVAMEFDRTVKRMGVRLAICDSQATQPDVSARPFGPQLFF